MRSQLGHCTRATPPRPPPRRPPATIVLQLLGLRLRPRLLGGQLLLVLPPFGLHAPQLLPRPREGRRGGLRGVQQRQPVVVQPAAPPLERDDVLLHVGQLPRVAHGAVVELLLQRA